MKKILFASLFLTMNLTTFANEIYFTKNQMNQFACKVVSSIKEHYPSKNLKDFRKEILNVLREDIDPWVDAYPIPAGISMPKAIQELTGLPGFPMDRSEYYLQNAFILYGNPKMELREPSENYFASFIHLARTRYISYLNGETKKFKLRNEGNLLEQIENHLPVVANFAYPYQDENGNPIKQIKAGAKEKDLYKLAIGVPSHEKYNEFVYESQRYNHFSSPLFMWLLKQENFSVTPEQLFDKALEIYGDPMVALGVIPWIFSGDALTVDRGTSSVVSHKMVPLVEGDDIPGLQYHFWGYLTQGFLGNKLRVGALAYVYEKLYQKDLQDWTVDVLSLTTGDKMRYFFNNPSECSNIK